MRWRIALTIFRKELLETVRDRRTLVVMLILPIVLYPLLLIGFTQVASHQVSQLYAMEGLVAVVGEIPEALTEVVAADAEKPAADQLNLKLLQLEQSPQAPATLGDDVEDPEIDALTGWAHDVLKNVEAHAILVIAGDSEERLEREDTSSIVILYDNTIDESRAVNDRLFTLLQSYRTKVVLERLAQHPDLSENFFLPLRIFDENIALPHKRGGYLAGRVLPMILIMMVLLGAFYPAVDLTAGEKERGTMQTLLTAPAQPLEIIFGKFMTVFCVSMASAMANLISMAAAFAWLVRDLPGEEEIVFRIGVGTVGMVFLQLIPIALLFAALMMAVAVFARSYKEAQNYLTPVYMLIIIPVTMVGLPGVKLVGFTASVPVLNIVLLMRDLMTEPPRLEMMTLVLIANVGYAILALVVAVRIFTTEQILLGGNGGLGDIFRMRPTIGGVRRATPMLSVSVFCIALVVLLYFGTMVQEANLIWGMAVTQWGLLLAPVLVLVMALKLDARETLMLRMPSLWGWVAAIILGLTSWAVLGTFTSWLQNLVLPVPAAFEQMMEKALGLTDADYPDSLLLLVFSVSPGICEEFLFRGLIMAGLRPVLKRWSTILLVSLMFGIFHISIYRILPTMVIGIVVTLVAYQTRSIWTGVLLHMINNATLLMVSKHSMLKQAAVDVQQVDAPSFFLPIPWQGTEVRWPVMSLYIVLFAAGLIVLMMATRNQAEDFNIAAVPAESP